MFLPSSLHQGIERTAMPLTGFSCLSSNGLALKLLCFDSTTGVRKRKAAILLKAWHVIKTLQPGYGENHHLAVVPAFTPPENSDFSEMDLIDRNVYRRADPSA